MSFRDENARYLRPMWIRAGLIYTGIIVFVVYAVWSWPADVGAYWPVGGGVALGLGVAIWKRGKRKSRVAQAFQNASADAAARLLFGDFLNQPGRIVVPVVVTGTAQVHVVYGNFARAEEMLAAYDWSKEPPLIRGDRHFVLGLLEHIRGNHEAGFTHFATLEPMMELPAIFPGTARLRRSIAFLKYTGKVLATGDEDAAKLLADPKLTRSSRLQRGVAAWALATAEERRGNHDAARRWLAESRAILPNAFGLGVERPADVVPLATRHDPANPYAAPSATAVDASPFEARQQPTFWRRHRLKVVGVWVVLLLGAHTYLSCMGHRS